MGYVTIATGLAQVLAPVLGGLLYSRSGYSALFGVAFGVIGLDFVLRLVMIERHVAVQWESSTMPLNNAKLNANTGADGSLPDSAANFVGTSNVETNATTNPTAPQEVANTTPSMTNPAFQLLLSRRFWTALWGICVLAALLTAFDSVSTQYTLSLTW